MTRDELYINNTKADLNKTDITLSYKSNLLTDISKIVSNSSIQSGCLKQQIIWL